MSIQQLEDFGFDFLSFDITDFYYNETLLDADDKTYSTVIFNHAFNPQENILGIQFNFTLINSKSDIILTFKCLCSLALKEWLLNKFKSDFNKIIFTRDFIIDLSYIVLNTTRGLIIEKTRVNHNKGFIIPLFNLLNIIKDDELLFIFPNNQPHKT
jgi:hypothetical protein